MRVSGRYITTRGYICPGTIIYILLLTAVRLYDSYYRERFGRDELIGTCKNYTDATIRLFVATKECFNTRRNEVKVALFQDEMLHRYRHNAGNIISTSLHKKLMTTASCM